MRHNIFTSTKHWNFTESDETAEEKFKSIEAEARDSLPGNFYQRPLVHLKLIEQTRLYQLMRTIPKGVLHHLHYFCSDDEHFYRTYILPDQRIYLTKDLKQMEIGTVQEAKQKGWVSMKQGQQTYGSDQWLRIVVDLTSFTVQEMQQMNYKSKQTWDIFERKIITPLKIMFVKDIYEKYSKHTLTKYIKNGYDRLQIRCTYTNLKEYDLSGNFVKEHGIQTFVNSLDEIIEQVTKQYPNFSFGFIFVGFKMFTDEYNEQIFREACDNNWNKLIGFDFVQEEDKYDSLERFDPIVDKVLRDYPHLSHLKKVYHAGETSNHFTDNIDVAVKAGTVRLGHGLNILQRIEFLPHCKHVCFEKNPISNLLLGYKSDLREASAPILLGLGYPVSLSPDDPGKFGLEDTTADYFIAALSYNWSLRHLKLIGYHSINHAVCEEGVKARLIKSFQISWNEWIHKFLESEHILSFKPQYHDEDIFTFCNNWSFSESEQQANKAYIESISTIIKNIREDIYQNNFIASKQLIKANPLHALLKNMPKGTLQSCHLLTNHDSQFIRSCIIPDHDIYLNDYSKELMIATPKESEMHAWTPLERLKLTYENLQDLAEYIYSLTSFTAEELAVTVGHQTQFWRIYKKKYSNLLTLLTSEAIFRKYIRYTLKKLAGLNYLRVEFRIEPISLISYSQNGQVLQVYDYSQMMNIIDEQYLLVKAQFSYFTIGIIVMGNKNLPREENYRIFDQFAASKWAKIIGFDFEQTIEDSFAPLNEYDEIVDAILMKYDDFPYEKLYQAGNSSNHFNINIGHALNSGSLRIANGLNILQQVNELSKCKKTCFQINPILNLAEGASKRNDFRLSIAPILLGLGFPISINSDLCGMIGFEDTLYDLFLAGISYNWTLKHMKLMIVHSISYSCTTKGAKTLMESTFEQRWSHWLKTAFS